MKKQIMKVNKKQKLDIDGKGMQKVLEILYDKALDGIPKTSKPIETIVDDYINKNSTIDEAVKDLIKYQVVKCGTVGFVTSLGGLITLPVAIPADVSSVLYIQMRMIAAIAIMGGYDIRADQTETMVLVCLTGSAMANILKGAGIKFGEKIAYNTIAKIPGKVLTKINQKVGMRLITKFGEKGVVNLVKVIPLVSGFVGAGIDVVDTNIIANNAYNLFIRKQLPKVKKKQTKNKK